MVLCLTKVCQSGLISFDVCFHTTKMQSTLITNATLPWSQQPQISLLSLSTTSPVNSSFSMLTFLNNTTSTIHTERKLVGKAGRQNGMGTI
jgi:hypothetical protein